MPTQINTDDIRDEAVPNSKLANDSASLSKVSGGHVSINEGIVSVNAMLSEQDDNDTFITYENGMIKTITIKNKSSEVLSITTINRNVTTQLITSVVEVVDGKTITQTVNRDENDNITSITTTIA